MIKIWLYLKSIIKYLLVIFIISGIVAYFFPTAALIVFGLCFIGMFSAVKEDVAIQYKLVLEKREKKRIQKVVMQSKDEFDGFEQAIALTRRNMS